MRSFFSFALAFVVVACGGSTSSSSSGASAEPTPTSTSPTTPAPVPTSPDAPQCTGESATLQPTGNTYDDSNASAGTTPISFEMFVYPSDRDAEAGTDAGISPQGAPSCPTEGLLAHSTSTVTLAKGTYLACRTAGSCGCLRVTLRGGPAQLVWLAGPGGGVLEVRGCATAEPVR